MRDRLTRERLLQGAARGARLAASLLSRAGGRLDTMAAAAAAAATTTTAAGTGTAATPAPPAARPQSDNRYEWRPASEALARLEILDSEDEERFEESGRQELDRLLPFVTPQSTVVDLGCGIGRIARYLAPHCATLWAVDASPRMLDLAEARLASLPNIRYALCADTTVPDVAAGSVDFLYSIIVLQHLEKEDAFLLVEDVVRMLRPGGRALLTWPNLLDEDYLQAFVRGARAGESTNLRRARMYTPAELERLLPAAGFSAVEVRDEPDVVTVCTR